MVARKPTAKEDGQKKTSSKADMPTPVKKPAPAKQTKPVKEKSTKHAPSMKASKVTEEASIRPFAQPQDDASANVVHDTPSPADAETGAHTEKSVSEGDTEIPNAGSNPGQSHVALAEPNPELMHEDFIAMVYPKVHKSLKHTNEKHVFLENLPSLSGTLSSMKNLDDAFTYGDQFMYEKPMEEEPDKVNVETKEESMVTVPIHQSSSTVPPLSTPVIDLTQPKIVSPPIQEPMFTATTVTTTTTLPPPPHPQQQSTTDPTLAARVSALEERYVPTLKRKTSSYRSQPEHTALYEDVKAFMDRENIDEYIEETAKS
nr:hypothetical protein [Tanacetum cinerariifolium]GEZ64855.1 hypothetical protein [Tanacetum cinerariifolium]